MKTSLLRLAALILPVWLLGQELALAKPANDDFAQATTISGQSGVISGTNDGGTLESNELVPFNNAIKSGASNSVWYSWTPTFTGAVTFSADHSGGDNTYREVSLFQGSSISGLMAVSGLPPSPPFYPQYQNTFNVSVGTVYRVRVLNYNTSDTQNLDFDLHWHQPAPSGFLISGPSTVSESVGTVDYLVIRGQDSGGVVTVDYAITPGTALLDKDYRIAGGGLANGTLVFLKGEETKTISIQIVDDAIAEAPEDYSIDLSNNSLGTQILTPSLQTTIVENPGHPKIAGPVTVDEDSGKATVVVNRQGGSDNDLDVPYETSDGSASDGVDYTAVTGVLHFADGEVSKSFNVPLIKDPAAEPSKEFNVFVGNNDDSNIVVILDHDRAAGDQFGSATMIAGSNGAVQVLGFNATVEPGEPGIASDGQSLWLTWVAPSTGAATLTTDVSCMVKVYKGGALNHLALVADSGSNPTVTFGVTANLTYRIQLSIGNATDLQKAAISLSYAIEPGGAIEFEKSDVIVDESAGTINLILRRIGGSAGAASVQYAFGFDGVGADLSAADYTAPANLEVDFPDGVSTATISIPLIDDTEIEGVESMHLNLSNPTGAILGNRTSTQVFVLDNDDEPINDNFSGSINLLGANGELPSIVVSKAKLQPGEPQLFSFSEFHFGLLWYHWTAPFTGLARFQTSGAVTSALGIYTGSSLAHLKALDGVTIAENVGGPTMQGQSATFPVVAGRVYQIAVEADGKDALNVDLAWFSYPDATAAGSIGFGPSSYRVEETAGTFSIDVIRTGSTARTTALTFLTEDGDAKAGIDYGALSQNLIFAPGETSKTVTVPIGNNPAATGDIHFLIGLSAQNAGDSVDPSTKPVTIQDHNDNPINDFFAGATILTPAAAGSLGGTLLGSGLEPNEVAVGEHTVWYQWTAPSGGLATFSAVLAAEVGVTLHVYTGSSLTALSSVSVDQSDTDTAAVRFSPTTGSVYRIAVTSSAAETFMLRWDTAPTGSLLSFAKPEYVIHEQPNQTVMLVVNRIGDLQTPVAVDFASVAGTATTADFSLSSGTLNFLAGQSSKTIQVTITDDALLEGDESFRVILSNPVSGAVIDQGSASVLILDDEAQPANDNFSGALSISGAAGSSPGTNVSATSEIGEANLGLTGARSVWFKWTAGASGLATFSLEGATNWMMKAFQGASVANLVMVGDTGTTEALSFQAVAGMTYLIAVDGLDGATGDFTLHWDTTLTGAIQFSSAVFPSTESAGMVTVTVSRVGGSTGDVIVHYATSNGSAKAGLDYTAVSGELAFVDGQTSAQFDVSILEDKTFEAVETVNLDLSIVQGDAALGALATAVITITDNDTFIAAKGTFAGLLRPGTFNQDQIGTLNLTMAALGSFSGKFTLGGKSFNFKGAFDAKGIAAPISIPRKGTTPLSLVVSIGDGGNQISGMVTGANISASFTGGRSGTMAARALDGNYTMLLPAVLSDPTSVPKGDGFATIVIKGGVATILGSLADSTAISGSAPVTKDGTLDLFFGLYANKGSLSGTLAFEDLAQISDADGALHWFKPANSRDVRYKSGFETDLSALASEYQFIQDQRILSVLNEGDGAALAAFGGGGLALELTQSINLAEDQSLALPLVPAVKMTLISVKAKGSLSGTFAPAPGAKGIPYKGVYFQKQGIAGGYFLKDNVSGYFSLGSQ